MVTEYEQLLQQMVEEGRAKLEAIKAKGGSAKEVREKESEIRFIEVELHRYQQGMVLFRTKRPPKVGRWGKPEADVHSRDST